MIAGNVSQLLSGPTSIAQTSSIENPTNKRGNNALRDSPSNITILVLRLSCNIVIKFAVSITVKSTSVRSLSLS